MDSEEMIGEPCSRGKKTDHWLFLILVHTQPTKQLQQLSEMQSRDGNLHKSSGAGPLRVRVDWLHFVGVSTLKPRAIKQSADLKYAELMVCCGMQQRYGLF